MLVLRQADGYQCGASELSTQRAPSARGAPGGVPKASRRMALSLPGSMNRYQAFACE